MNRFAIKYSYTEIYAMHLINMYSFNCVRKCLNCKNE